jgi:hypothetical protein
MNLKNRQQLLIVVASAVVALFVLDRLVIGPLTTSWKQRSETIGKLRESIKQGQSLVDRETITRGAWHDMRRNTLPGNASQAEKALLEAFDQWSRESRVTVNSIKPQWKRGATDDYSLLECRVDAAGDLGTLTKFLYEVEHSEMALRIEAVELTARDNDGKQLALGLSVSGLRLAPLGNN